MTNYLDDLKGKTLLINGVEFPDRKRLEFTGTGATGSDDPISGATVIDLNFESGTPAVSDPDDLRDVSSPTSGDVYTTAYALNAGDGGGGVWTFVDGAGAGTYVDNTGTVIVPSGGDGSGAWLRQFDTYIDCRWFGVGTVDDSAAIQAAMDAAGDLDCGQTVIFHGLYVAKDLLVRANTRLLGATKDCGVKGAAGYINIVYALSVDDVTVEHMRIEGRVVEDGFDVGQNAFNLRANITNRVTFRDVQLIGARVDGILTQDSNVVRIENCFIDGVNGDNRNGISCTSGDDIQIRNTVVKNHARSDMPGAIDFESHNANEVMRNVIVDGCYFENITGAFGCLQLGLNATQTDYENGASAQACVNFTFSNNTFGPGITNLELLRVHQTQASPSTETPNNIQIFGNRSVGGDSGVISLQGINGCRMDHNYWTGQNGWARFGTITGPDRPVHDLEIGTAEKYFQCFGGHALATPYDGGSGLEFRNIDRARIWPNMEDCGKLDLSRGFGLQFSGGASSYVDVSRCTRVAGTRGVGIPVRVTGGHVLAPETNRFRGFSDDTFQTPFLLNSFEAHERGEDFVGEPAFVKAVADSGSTNSADFVYTYTSGVIVRAEWLLRVTVGASTTIHKIEQGTSITLGGELLNVGLTATPGLPAGVAVTMVAGAVSSGTYHLNIANTTGAPIYNVHIVASSFRVDDDRADDPIMKHSPQLIWDSADWTINSGRVEAFADQSLIGNPITEATPAERFAEIVGWRGTAHGAATCADTEGMGPVVLPVSISQPFTFVWVGTWKQTAAAQFLINGTAFMQSNGNRIRLNAGANLYTVSEPAEDAAVIIVGQCNGASSSITYREEGGSNITANGDAGAGAMTQCGLSETTAGLSHTGEFASLDVVSGTLTSEELIEVINFKREKYGI